MKFLVLALLVAAAVAAPVPDDDSSNAVELIVNGVPEGTPLELGGIVDMHLNEHVNGQLAASSNLLHPYTAVGIAEAAAIAAAAAAENAPTPVEIVHQPESDFHISPEAIILLPETVEIAPPSNPEIAPIQLPSPVLPESAVVPEPLPAPIVMPSPVAPEVAPEAETIVVPAPLPPVVLPQPEPVLIAEPESIVPPPSPPTVIAVPAPVEIAAPLPPTVPEVPEPIPEPAAQGPNEIFNNGVVQVQVNAPEDAGMFATLQNWFSLVVNYISNGIQTSQQIV